MMTLQDAQNMIRLHQGRLKAFAFRRDTIKRMAEELGFERFIENVIENDLPFTFLGIPVVWVGATQPEGVIV